MSDGERTSKVVFGEMVELVESMKVDNTKWAENGVKSAAGRMRKGSLSLDHLGKEFRKLSIAESK